MVLDPLNSKILKNNMISCSKGKDIFKVGINLARQLTYEYVIKQLRRKSFGILSTVSPRDWSQSTGIIYGVSSSKHELSIWIITSKDAIKTKNIQQNPHVSFVVPFPRRFLSFVPPGVIHFQGKAEILPIDNQQGYNVFQQNRILRMNYRLSENVESIPVFIRIKPHKKVNCYMIGVGILEILRNPEI